MSNFTNRLVMLDKSIIFYTFAAEMKNEEDFFYQFIGNKIKEFRIKAQFNQDNLAKYLNLSRTSIVNIEKGRQHPTMFTIYQISTFLNVQVYEFFPDKKNKVKVTETMDESIISFLEKINPEHEFKES